MFNFFKTIYLYKKINVKNQIKLPFSYYIRYYCPVMVTKTPVISDVRYFMEVLHLNQSDTKKLLRTYNKNKELVDRVAILKSINKLNDFGYKIEEIIEYDSIIETSSTTLENHYQILEECGFKNILLYALSKYVVLMNRSITMLKTHGHIPYEENVLKTIISKIHDVQITFKNEISETITLNMLRQIVLNLYLTEKLQMTDIEINKLWKTYPRLKHKSFDSISKSISILKNELNFPIEKIMKNLYLLHADPLNIQAILTQIPIMAGHDIHEILNRRPKIMMSNCESLLKTLDTFKKYEIPDSSVARCLEVLTLGPNTIVQRLNDLKNIQEFNVLTNNPRILRLVHYQKKARTRLDYLRQSKIKCASLHILSSNSEAFERYARDGTDRTKGLDISNYLSKHINKSEFDIRNILSRHPNWCHVPILSVKESMDYLQTKGFKCEDIYKNLHLVLYPISRIETKLKLLNERKTNIPKLKIDWNTLSASQLLGLCLYLIESEFHFTGDGIWSEPQSQDTLTEASF